MSDDIIEKINAYTYFKYRMIFMKMKGIQINFSRIVVHLLYKSFISMN